MIIPWSLFSAFLAGLLSILCVEIFYAGYLFIVKPLNKG